MRVTFIAEIGINASGSVPIAIDLMRVAKAAGCDAVKFQKRDLDLAIPPLMREHRRETPWGPMRYDAYKARVEFDRDAFVAFARASDEIGIAWSASAFDPPSVAFLSEHGAPWIKIPSATLTDAETLHAARATGLPILMSTGGSTWAEIDIAVETLSRCRLTLLHCCSLYPHSPSHSRLLVLDELRQRYGLPVGYSGHEEPGSNAVTLGAVARGSSVIERHITLSRLMWGSDQRASLEPHELEKLVSEVRRLSDALTTGAERAVDDAERAKIKTMRRTEW